MAKKREGKSLMNGRFTPGNTYGGSNKPTGIPHPDYPHLDTTGHPLPGCSLNPMSAQNAKGQSIPMQIHQLRVELLNCANKNDIQAVYNKLFAMTQSTDFGGGIQLEAIKLYLERFFGKPTAEVNIQQKTTTTKVNVDLTALSDEELQTYMQLQGKVQTLALEDKREDDIVIDQGDRG
jgi:hypothetical protein